MIKYGSWKMVREEGNLTFLPIKITSYSNKTFFALILKMLQQ